MAEIQFNNISKQYGNVVAVDNISFNIYDGEYLSILGPSGCGKTTTLRMIAGLVQPTKGKILWDGKQVEHIPAAERDIGYVFQQFAIFPHLSIWDNIAFGPDVKGFSRKDTIDLVEEYLKLVGLEDKADLYPPSLNAADKQRTGIARVLATGAKTLLLDEPMGALDFKIRERFQDELVSIVKRLELTAIHVTHDQSEAMAISDRIGVMKKGKMVQLGSPNDLLFRPSRLFTAHFIGEADFLEGIVVRVDASQVTIDLIGYERIVIIRNANVTLNPRPGDRIILGVRREFFDLQSRVNEPTDLTNKILGTVISDRFVGEKLRTKVQLDYGRSIEIKRLPMNERFQAGQEVSIHVPKEGSFLFRYPSDGLDQALEVT